MNWSLTVNGPAGGGIRLSVIWGKRNDANALLDRFAGQSYQRVNADAIYIVAVKKQLPAMPRATFREWLGTARKAIWGLLLMFIILGGIYSGMFTPTEAAAVAAVYSGFPHCLLRYPGYALASWRAS